MPITQEQIDRGDIVDPELMEQLQADLDKPEDEDPVEDPEDEEEDQDEEEVDDDDDDEDEDSGEGDSDEEDEDEEQAPEDEEGDVSDSESEEEDDTGDEGNRIPLSRLNKALAQRDAEKLQREAEHERTLWLEKQLEKLIAAKQLPEKDEVVEEPFDFAKAETDYIDFILEGETQKAAELRAEIDAEKIELIRQDIAGTKEETRGEIKAIKEQETFDLAIENFESKYPFMDNSHDDYNEEAVDTTNALMQGFMADGETSRTDALAKAVERVAPMYEKKSKPSLGDKKTSKRTKETRKKNLKAIKQTPPKTRGKRKADRNVDDIKVSDLADKEFKSLTRREKAALRGDIIS